MIVEILEDEDYPVFSFDYGYVEFTANLKQKNIDKIKSVMRDYRLLQHKLKRLRSIKREMRNERRTPN